MFVIPADGLLVPHPEAPQGGPRHLPPEGAEVPDTAYWRRRLGDGDVRLAPEEANPPAAPEAREAPNPPAAPEAREAPNPPAAPEARAKPVKAAKDKE